MIVSPSSALPRRSTAGGRPFRAAPAFTSARLKLARVAHASRFCFLQSVRVQVKHLATTFASWRSPSHYTKIPLPRLDLEGGHPLAPHRALKVWSRILDRAACGRFRRLLPVTTRPSAGQSVLTPTLGPSRCARALVCRRGSERSPQVALRRGVQ